MDILQLNDFFVKQKECQQINSI